MRAARAWAGLAALSSSLVGPTGSEYVGWTLMEAGRACWRLGLIPIEDSDTCFGEAARFVGLDVSEPGYVADTPMNYVGCIYSEATHSLAFFSADLNGDLTYEGDEQFLCTGQVTTTSMTSDSSTTSMSSLTTSSTTSTSTSTTSTTTRTTTTTSTSTTTSSTTYTGEATLKGTMVFQVTSAGGSARRLTGTSVDAELVDEAARAALASVFDVDEQTISLSSSPTGNLWTVEYALVGTYPEMLVARDATQGMVDGSGVLEAALNNTLGSLSAQLVLGTVLADRGEVLLGTHPFTNTLTSTSSSSYFTQLPGSPMDEGESQEANVVVLLMVGACSMGGLSIAGCVAKQHRRRRRIHQREKDMKGFDSIAPTSAWGGDDGGTVSGTPPLKEGHHQDVQPGLPPEFHVTWD